MNTCFPPEAPAPAGTRVVLMGEPDPPTRELYGRALRPAFTVIPAGDADTVLAVLRTREVAVLVLEPMMFAARGWEPLAAIGRACAERQVRLVVCSTLDERSRGRDLGVAAYLVKPTLPGTLLATLQQVLGS